MINPFKAMQVYFAVSKGASQITQEIKMVQATQPKSGFFSSEFLVTLAASIAAMWGPARSLVPEPYQKYASIAEIAGAGIYTICRTAPNP